MALHNLSDQESYNIQQLIASQQYTQRAFMAGSSAVCATYFFTGWYRIPRCMKPGSGDDTARGANTVISDRSTRSGAHTMADQVMCRQEYD